MFFFIFILSHLRSFTAFEPKSTVRDDVGCGGPGPPGLWLHLLCSSKVGAIIRGFVCESLFGAVTCPQFIYPSESQTPDVLLAAARMHNSVSLNMWRQLDTNTREAPRHPGGISFVYLSFLFLTVRCTQPADGGGGGGGATGPTATISNVSEKERDHLHQERRSRPVFIVSFAPRMQTSS